MIVREAPCLLPGAYLIGIRPEASHMAYQDLRATLIMAIDTVARG